MFNREAFWGSFFGAFLGSIAWHITLRLIA